MEKLDRIVPTWFGRLVVMQGGKAEEQQPEEEQPDIIVEGFYVPYALLGITGLEEEIFNDQNEG